MDDVLIFGDDLAELRSWLGMLAGFQVWFSGISKGETAMRRYLRKDAIYEWTTEMNLCSPRVVKPFYIYRAVG